MKLAGRRPGRRSLLILTIAAAVVAVDQATKTWALNALADGPRHVLGTLQLNLSFNPGAAFGVGKGLGPWILVGGILVMLYLARYSRHMTGWVPTLAIGLVLGGAAGNLVDRLFRGHGGAVVDFIDLQWWPIFNVADMAISIGAVLLIISASREQE